MRLGQKPRSPNAASILRTVEIIRRCIPTDGPPGFEWRTSYQGTPNLRITGVTNSMEWIADVYSSHYIRVQVADLSSVCKDPRRAVLDLGRYLGLSHVEPRQEQV